MKREVIYLLSKRNDIKTIEYPIASCGSYLEAVKMSAPWHNKRGWHRRIKRVSIRVFA
jgi:hypothetical protein